jgi:3-hydroxyisobutyrate dehydrogenase-like beta-hydroxyacid dehydrogenase
VEQVLTREFNFGGALRIIRKDMDAWRQMIDDLDVKSPISNEVYKIYMRAMDVLRPDEDMTSITKYYEEMEGVTVPKTILRHIKS